MRPFATVHGSRVRNTVYNLTFVLEAHSSSQLGPLCTFMMGTSWAELLKKIIRRSRDREVASRSSRHSLPDKNG